MSISQAEVEEMLRVKALARKPRLEAALAKLENKIANWETHWPHQGHKVEDWKNLCEQYKADLALIAKGSYHGYNGKPFGATPTLAKGVIL